VADTIGEQYLIPLLQVVSHADDLDMAALTDPCVIKGTHGCNMTILLPEGAPRNERAIRSTVRRWLATDFYRTGWRETPYRGLPPRAVVERFIGTGGAPPSDYKFFVFHGKVGMVVVDQDRFSAHTSTLLHPDYHTPADNADRIDFVKLTRMTRWMYATGRAVAEADKAPAVDPAFKLERCRDSTGDYCGG
jgi:hypothetical protein